MTARAMGFLGLGLTALGIALIDYATRRILGTGALH